MDVSMAFPVHEQAPPGIEVRVNFGVYAGRDATTAEIERLAEWLLDEVGEVSIVSEKRYEIDSRAEASVHQVRIEVAANRTPDDPADRRALEHRILERAEYWARQCVAERHVEVSDF